MGRFGLLLRLCTKCLRFDRKMLTTSASNRADHLTVTQASSRKEIVSPAEVVEIKDLSSTVKVLSLKVKDKNLTFKAGQWVDTFIPGLETVGGFSMCSSPALLRQQRILQLAIKFSNHPPAFWVHTECKAGDTLLLRAGGDFYFDPQPGETPCDVLLVAGGVGINPLYSIVQEVVDINRSPAGPYGGNLVMLFSAKTSQELIFQDDLENISTSNSNITTMFFVTRESDVPDSTKAGQISLKDIQQAVQGLKTPGLKVFMCGPSAMVHDMEKHCLSFGISKKQIFFEKWW